MLKYLLFPCIFIIALGCKHDPIVPAHEICFDTEIFPILMANCSMCHKSNSGSRAENYDLTNYNSIIGRNVDRGNPDNSRLYTMLKDNGSHKNRVTPAQRSLIYEWIKQGANNDITCSPEYCDSTDVTFDNQIKKLFQNRCDNCHNGNQYPNLTIKDSAIAYARLPDSLNYLLLKMQNNHAIVDTTKNYTKCEVTLVRKWIISGAN